MNAGIEIIDFYQPYQGRKSLFINNIPAVKTENKLTAFFYDVFSPYGLLYSVQLFMNRFEQRNKTESGNQSVAGGNCYYAFINFYSSLAATRAKESLNHSININDAICKISFSKRKKELTERSILHFTRCYDLINFYLGFNSWSTSIKTVFSERPQTSPAVGTEDAEGEGDDVCTEKYVCLIDLKVCDLHTEGIGVAQHIYSKTDPMGRINATCACKKMSQHRAIENAFSKVVLVVLGNGKVSVEIDTTRVEPLMQEHVKEEQLIKVTELDDQPSDDDEETTDNNEEKISETTETSASLRQLQQQENVNIDSQNLDELNLQILQELCEEM